MKKLILTLLVLWPMVSYAQNPRLLVSEDQIPTLVERIMAKRDSVKNDGCKIRKINSHINLEFLGSANAYFTGGKFDETSFKMNMIRLEIYGNVHKHLSYHFRQAFNKSGTPNSVDNISSSLECANITWKQSDKFNLIVGKQCLAVAGYENWVNGIKVREFSVFNDSYALFQAGITGVVNITPTQQLNIQVANNRGNIDGLRYGLPEGMAASKVPLLGTVNWTGSFADKSVLLMYSASAGQLAKGRNMYYLMCGNIYQKQPFLAYIDVLYARSAFDIQQRVMAPGISYTAQNVQYLTLIANLDYQFHPKWNAFVKGVYETVGVYEANGAFGKGRYLTQWNAQACLEWFPFTEDKGFKVFAHYVYKGHTLSSQAKALGAVMPHTQRVSLGIQYIIPVL